MAAACGIRRPGRPKPVLFGSRFNFGPRVDEGFVPVTRRDPHASDSKEFHLYYRVYNPSIVRSAESPPLIVVHGGPSLPSNYLYPLAQQFSGSRSIVFYDQLGCGRSSQPKDASMYSIEDAVRDLAELVRSLQLEKFHLLGHSFGGIVAYEYAKADEGNGKCLSLTLDSTPSNMKTSLEECSRLEDEIKSELLHEDVEDEDAKAVARARLRQRCECLLEELPDPLVAAIESRGTTFGPEAVSDYVAGPPEMDYSLPPVLMIRGEHDFITERCIEGWRDIFSLGSYREEEMRDCAHYCHLEDARSFGDLIKSHFFVNDY